MENNPNSIRVTTPSGSTIHSIGGGRSAQAENVQNSAVPNPPYLNQRPPGWQPPLQHSVESPEATFSVPATNGAIPYQTSSAQGPPFENQSPATQQRGTAAVSQSNSAGSHPQPPRNAHTPTPGPGQSGVNGNSSQSSMEKRGPVEFNHAISYVNKIKVSGWRTVPT